MDLGPHATFIIASYAAVSFVLGAMIAWLLYDGAQQKRLLEDLEARGVRRRSRGGNTKRKSAE
ncbi:MAG: heme exporter protein CcmD [Alphaproteobacteria bacterium]|nr:heme exporter protein CcmD [Alphaproteobacteria bacterium]